MSKALNPLRQRGEISALEEHSITQNTTRYAMQVVHLHWNRSKMAGTGIDDLLVPCSNMEVVAHLAISELGVRQLMRCDFREGFGPEDLSNSEYLTFETTLHHDNGTPPVVVFNTHPLAVASAGFTDVAVIPPYTFSEEGISISLRGIPSGISNFLSMAREIMPPDNIRVVNEEEGETGPQDLLGERQWEVVQAAVQWGYYDDPRRVSLRQMAERLDMARSTIGEHLHNAEATLIRWLVEQK